MTTIADRRWQASERSSPDGNLSSRKASTGPDAEPLEMAPKRRVLMVTPHFPPDQMAAAHRVRLLAPYMADCGWEPIVLTIDPSGYESATEPELVALVPSGVRVVRSRAWSARWTRRVGIGDLGLRAFWPLLSAASALMRREPVDAVFITTYPIYTAALGPALQRRFGTPFVIDIQDPWVGAWGRTVGGGRKGSPDFKSRLSRSLAAILEPHVLGSASALTAVSMRTLRDAVARVPAAQHKPCVEIPIGGDARDFVSEVMTQAAQPYFDPSDGFVHLCSVGTILPLGLDVVRALFAAVAELRARRPAAAARLRIHFFGSSNERGRESAPRVMPLARDAGLADLVDEHPARIDYIAAMRVLVDASAIVLLGSTEPHYTASRLYPALLARRPLLAIYHRASTVTATLERWTRPPTVHVVAFDETDPVGDQHASICAALETLAQGPVYRGGDVNESEFYGWSAPVLARRLSTVLDSVIAKAVRA